MTGTRIEISTGLRFARTDVETTFWAALGLATFRLVVFEAGFDAITGIITSTFKGLCFYSLLTVSSNISVRYNKLTTSWPFDMLNPDNCTGVESPSFNWLAASRKAA